MARYSNAFGHSSTLAQSWRWLLALSIGCYLLNLGLRLGLWTVWDNPMLRVGDEFIMSTHDTYLWLAHSRVAQFGDGRSLAYFTKLLHEFLGLSLGSIGFWGPAFLSSLVAIPCVLWGWFLGGRSGAIFAGIVGSLAPGFYGRSRLGYYDTDLFTLLMPLLTAFFLAWWLRQRTSFRWLPQEDETTPSKWLPFQILAIGLFARFAGWWHQDIANYTALLSLLAIAVGIAFARKGQRTTVLFEAAIFMLSGIPAVMWSYNFSPLYYLTGNAGYIVLMILLGAGLATWRFSQGSEGVASRKLTALAALVFAAAFILAGFFSGPLGDILNKLLLYLKPASTAIVSTGGKAAGPIFPRVTQSIIEAKSIPLSIVMNRVAYYTPIGLAALAAVIPVLAARPLAVLLLPMVALSLLSMKMGVRFSMFGGAPLMIILGACGAALCRGLLPKDMRFRAAMSMGAMAVLGLSLLLPGYTEYRELRPTPVLDKIHAEALIGLGKRAPKDAVVWTWWDWGYATQYYAGLKTPSDGGRHSGRDLFPTAVAMATTSPLQANQLLRYSAAFPMMDPTVDWAREAGSAAQASLEKLGNESIPLKKVPTQYLVVSYKDIRIAKWIMFYGNWDMSSGTTEQPTLRRFGPGQVAVNPGIGGVMTGNGRKNAITSMDLLDIGKSTHYDYPQNTYSPRLVPKTPHLLFNKAAGESSFFDSKTYDSMLVRLFTGDPESDDIKPYFRLVADGLPFVRIYEVLQ